MSVVKALGEIALRVNDLEVMQRFYEQVVGLELIKRFPQAAFFKIAQGFGGHTQILALFDRADAAQGPKVHRTTPDGVDSGRSTLDHLAFEIDLADYEAEKSRLSLTSTKGTSNRQSGEISLSSITARPYSPNS